MNKLNKVKPQWPISQICREAEINYEHIAMFKKVKAPSGALFVNIWLSGVPEPLEIECEDEDVQETCYQRLKDDLASWHRYKHRLIDQFRLQFEDLKKVIQEQKCAKKTPKT